MQDGISFDPVRPPPLQTWQVVLALIFFLVLIAAIFLRMRRRPEKNPGSLDLDRH